MSKTKADNLKKISTAFLKKHGYFSGWRSGTITWTSGWDDSKSSVGIEVSTMNEQNYLRIHYTQTDRDTDKKKDFDYKVPLNTTSCRYGGKRYWFTCPWYKNGAHCGKRVGVLYKNGDYFACRHCYDLTYDCRNLSGYAKALGSTASIPELERLEGEVKRMYYGGKPTKKYLRLLKKDEEASRAIAGMVLMLQGRVNKLARRK